MGFKSIVPRLAAILLFHAISVLVQVLGDSEVSGFVINVNLTRPRAPSNMPIVFRCDEEIMTLSEDAINNPVEASYSFQVIIVVELDFTEMTERLIYFYNEKRGFSDSGFQAFF